MTRNTGTSIMTRNNGTNCRDGDVEDAKGSVKTNK